MGLDVLKPDIEDTSYLSKYFVIAEFNPVFTGGKNPVAFNGSSLLKAGTEIQVECLDSNGNSLYTERPHSNVSYSDVANFVISVSIFEETYNGPGKLILVGTTVKGETVRWIGNIAIDKTLQNVSKVRFYNKPTIECRGLLYPVVTNNTADLFTKTVNFSGSFFTLPVNPKKDVNRRYINSKKTDIDYRILLNVPDSMAGPTLYPTTSFNTQMEGQSISIMSTTLQVPHSYLTKNIHQTASFKIKNVIDSKTMQVSEPFYYTVGKDQFVTNINLGVFTTSYTWTAYNTASDDYLKFVDISTGTTTYIKQSYAEIVYRNIQPFSGFISRHKLYRKSMVYPGDFQLIADEPLNALELLVDPITNNKTYALIGSFYNQSHIQRYWFTSSNVIHLSHSVKPYIDAVKITTPQYSQMDGTKYAIAKADSINSVNDYVYYPYDSESFNRMTGSAYNSNFISLKAGSLYVLSTNVVMEKLFSTHDAKIDFFFTSSSPRLQIEKDYLSSYGLKLGTVSTNENATVKVFADKQMLYFTPNSDYYGTLVIVPYHCNVTLSEMSLKVYGDYGFSPDVLFTKIPFKINIANESFQLKAELYDINSTLVYSDLSTIQTFDANGESLYANSGLSDPTLLTFVSGSLTISQSLYIPNIGSCPSVGTRLLGWRFPTSFPPDPATGDGAVCYTNVSEISNINGNYVNVTTTAGTVATTKTARAIAVKYTGSAVVDGTFTGPFGRRISIDPSGIKTVYS